MKSLIKVFIALLLTVTIAFVSFNTHANSLPLSSVDHHQVSSSVASLTSSYNRSFAQRAVGIG